MQKWIEHLDKETDANIQGCLVLYFPFIILSLLLWVIESFTWWFWGSPVYSKPMWHNQGWIFHVAKYINCVQATNLAKCNGFPYKSISCNRPCILKMLCQDMLILYIGSGLDLQEIQNFYLSVFDCVLLSFFLLF